MRPASYNHRDLLAAQYVLGTLSPLVRRRFGSLLRYDADLRRRVAHWETQLAPMDAATPARLPPDRVWRLIESRVRRAPPRSRLWDTLAFWRNVSAVSLALVVVVGGWFVIQPPPETPPGTIAVLADDKAQPRLVVSWPAQRAAEKFIQVKLLGAPQVPANAAWELWLLPPDKGAPVSAGLIGRDNLQRVRLPDRAGQVLGTAWGFAISVEPPGGSPTGQPTGPVVLSGPCVKVI
jgi:anti-sigma-K factor RskA